MDPLLRCRTARLPSLLAALMLWAAAGTAAGCASKQKTTDGREEAKSKKSSPGDSDIDGPSADQLADAPCGNPDWAQLPPDHQEDGDPDEAASPATEDARKAGDEGDEEEK